MMSFIRNVINRYLFPVMITLITTLTLGLVYKIYDARQLAKEVTTLTLENQRLKSEITDLKKTVQERANTNATIDQRINDVVTEFTPHKTRLESILSGLGNASYPILPSTPTVVCSSDTSPPKVITDDTPASDEVQVKVPPEIIIAWDVYKSAQSKEK